MSAQQQKVDGVSVDSGLLKKTLGCSHCKVGDEFVDSPIKQVRNGANAVVGVQVTGRVELNNGTVVGAITANPAVATTNALPETDGTLLNENSTIDGGYFA